MTRNERQELRQIQEALIVALAKITEMLGTSKPSKYTRPESDSEAKERFIAP